MTERVRYYPTTIWHSATHASSAPPPDRVWRLTWPTVDAGARQSACTLLDRIVASVRTTAAQLGMPAGPSERRLFDKHQAQHAVFADPGGEDAELRVTKLRAGEGLRLILARRADTRAVLDRLTGLTYDLETWQEVLDISALDADLRPEVIARTLQRSADELWGTHPQAASCIERVVTHIQERGLALTTAQGSTQRATLLCPRQALQLEVAVGDLNLAGRPLRSASIRARSHSGTPVAKAQLAALAAAVRAAIAPPCVALSGSLAQVAETLGHPRRASEDAGDALAVPDGLDPAAPGPVPPRPHTAAATAMRPPQPARTAGEPPAVPPGPAGQPDLSALWDAQWLGASGTARPTP